MCTWISGDYPTGKLCSNLEKFLIMDGFSFPPPPPPPPKAASSVQQDAPSQFNNQRGGGGRGGRGSSRGRGGAPQRGGGRPQHQNTGHTGYGQNNTNYQQNYANAAPFQQQYQAPPGSYVNPAFSGYQTQVYPQAQGYPQFQNYQAPGSIPQYGQQNQYAQQNQYSSGQSNTQLPGNPNNPNYSPGAKRTRDQAFGHAHRGHPMKKPASAPKAQVAPSVPSFGAPILPPKPSAPLSSSGGVKSRPTASLGLIPQTYGSGGHSSASEDEDEEEVEVDEEAALSALQNGPLSFEFNGELATLSSATDIAEWIAERKKRWPSKRRVEEKEQEVQARMEERKRIEQETRAAIASASGGEYQPVVREDRKPRDQDTSAREKTPNPTLEDTQKELALQMQKVQELQTLLAQNQQAQPLDPNQRPSEPNPLDPTNQPEPQTRDPNPSDSDTDSAPEETSSKPDKPIRVPPPQPPHSKTAQAKQQHQQQQGPKQCVSFASQGRCKFGNKCRYKHDVASSQQKGKRMTLYQRVSLYKLWHFCFCWWVFFFADIFFL